jgi:hypothetical protein
LRAQRSNPSRRGKKDGLLLALLAMTTFALNRLRNSV